MNRPSQPSQPSSRWDSKPARIFLLAAWFGLIAGLLEGTGAFVLGKLGWINWTMADLVSTVDGVWVPAVFDLVLFTIVGSLIILVGRFFPWLAAVRLSAFAFALLTFLDWLLLTGRVQYVGSFMLALGLATAFLRWFRRNETAMFRLCRQSISAVVTIALLALLGIQGAYWLRERIRTAEIPTGRSGSPNILVIVVDTLRADHLSSYAYARHTTPNIDRVAQQGVLFDNAISASSWTLPSHASLLTGRYPHEHGAEKNGQRLDGRFPTISGTLLAHGYRTGAFSGNNYAFSRAHDFDRGFIHFEDYFSSVVDMAVRTVYGRTFEHLGLFHLGFRDFPARKRAAEINKETLRWIGRDSEKPFFAFLNYFDAHDPYLPPQPYRSRFSKIKNPGGIIFGYALREYPEMTTEQLQSEMDAYDGAIAYIDDQIGQLLNELNRRGFGQNTLVVITADHGESFGEHGLLTHRNALYREVIHVPLIFYWPGHIPAGARVSRPVSNVDLPTTLLDLVGEHDLKIFPGPSLAELWENPSKAGDWPLPLAEMAQMPFWQERKNPAYSGSLKSIISPDWHYILHQKWGAQLYDWSEDPEEANDIVKTQEGQSIAQEFANRLHTMLQDKLDASSAIVLRGMADSGEVH